MTDTFNAILRDRLRELGNIGCGHALTALSQLTAADFRVQVPDIELIDYRGVPDKLGAAQTETVGVTVEVLGELEGIFMLLLRPEIAAHILAALGVRAPADFRALAPRQSSALLELGNILCNSYMNAVSEMTGLEIGFSVPSYAVDMLGAILNMPIVRFAERSSRMLYIQNVFTIEGRDWIGSILLLPELSSAHTLGERLGAWL